MEDLYFQVKFSESDTILISYVGYKSYSEQISQLNENQIIVELQKIYLQSQTILVEASVGKKGITPIAFDKINKDEIQKDYVSSGYSKLFKHNFHQQHFILKMEMELATII